MLYEYLRHPLVGQCVLNPGFSFQVQTDPGGPSSVEKHIKAFGDFPLTMSIGGLALPVPFTQAAIVMFSRDVDTLDRTAEAPFWATTFIGLCSKLKPLLSIFHNLVGSIFIPGSVRILFKSAK